MRFRRRIHKTIEDVNNMTPEVEAQKPTLVDKAVHLAKAVVEHAADGLRRVTPEQFNERLNVCNECEYRDGMVCQHKDCGCFLNIKCWWASEKCPIDKWGVL